MIPSRFVIVTAIFMYLPQEKLSMREQFLDGKREERSYRLVFEFLRQSSAQKWLLKCYRGKLRFSAPPPSRSQFTLSLFSSRVGRAWTDYWLINYSRRHANESMRPYYEAQANEGKSIGSPKRDR